MACSETPGEKGASGSPRSRVFPLRGYRGDWLSRRNSFLPRRKGRAKHSFPAACQARGRLRFDNYEIASRMSYLLVDSQRTTPSSSTRPLI